MKKLKKDSGTFSKVQSSLLLNLMTLKQIATNYWR